MSTPAKINLGILTFLPLCFGLFFFVYFMSILKEVILTMPQDNAQQEIFMKHVLIQFFTTRFVVMALLFFIISLALKIYYIVHAATHIVRPVGEKIMWILLFIFIGTISYIIYFFMRIVPPQPKTTANSIEPLTN